MLTMDKKKKKKIDKNWLGDFSYTHCWRHECHDIIIFVKKIDFFIVEKLKKKIGKKGCGFSYFFDEKSLNVSIVLIMLK